MSRKNANVSVSALTRDERRMIKDFVVKVKVPSQHGNAKSNVWQYFGSLHCETDTQSTVVDAERFYCRNCLDDLHKAPASQQHISAVQSYKITTSTANLKTHLVVKHGMEDLKDEATKRVTDYFKSYSAADSAAPCSSSHEFNRDIALWICRDLESFGIVEKDGFRDFMAKNLPTVTLPCARTIANEALTDVYLAVKKFLKKELETMNAVCVMFDG
jgi:hypothetical protein